MARLIVSVVQTLLLLVAASSVAAECSVGVYADRGGTGGVVDVYPGNTFHVYVVAFDESALNAVAYSLIIPRLNVDVFLLEDATLYGPGGNGINIRAGGTNNVGLGECAIGFGGRSILVTDYTLHVPGNYVPSQVLIAQVPSEGTPAVSNCAGQIRPCAVGPPVLYQIPIPTEATSFSAVKSLYGAHE